MRLSQVSTHLRDYGYIFIPQWDSAISTREVASRVGKIVEIDKFLPGSDVPTVQTLKPHAEHESSHTKYSGVFGLNEFPLHTDLAHWSKPPRYFILRCIRGSSDVATRLLPASAVLHAIGENVLRRALVKPRRSSGLRATGLLTLTFSLGQTLGFRWDSLFLTPMNDTARDVMEFMKDPTTTWDEMNELVLCDPGDTLVIDNWRFLHGRGKAISDKDRAIERVYLSELII